MKPGIKTESGAGKGSFRLFLARRRFEGLRLPACAARQSGDSVDVNAENTDGRTALDSAKTLKFDSVTAFLVEKGARPGTPKGRLPEPAVEK